MSRLLIAMVMVGMVPLNVGEQIALAAPTWVPGTFWVATARSGLSNSNSPHGNAVAAYGNGTYVVGGSGTSLSPYLISSTDGSTFTSRKKADWSVSQYERTNNVVTLTTTADHLVSVTEKFPITDVTLASALGTTTGSSFVVTAIPSSTKLSFTLAGIDIAPTSGTFTIDFRNNGGASALVFGGEVGNEVFLMSAPSGPNKVWRSQDGVTWSVVAYHGDNGGRSSNSWTSAAYGEGKFVALTDSSSNRVIYSADNGTTWLSATVPAGLTGFTWSSIAYGDGRFVAVSTGVGQVMTSEDGITWTAGQTVEANQWKSVTYGGGNFMAVAMSGTNRIMTSEDGLVWVPRNVSAHLTAQWRAVAWAGSAFVVTGANSTIAATTDLGVSWTSMVDGIGGGGAFNNATITAMVWNGSLLLGVPNETGKGISHSFAPSAPTISNQTPITGTSAGGTSVTFTGNWLRSVTSVTVDGVAATITARNGGATLTTTTNNSSSLTITMPAGTNGGQRSIVLNGLMGTATGSFTYTWSAPTLTTSVSSTGSATGGDSVTLTGTNLNGASAVTLGTSVTNANENKTDVTSFSVTGTTSITAVVPPRPCGQTAPDWYFRVTTPGGTTSGSTNYKHTYSAASPPTVTLLSATSGDVSGGQNVVITGSNFTCVSSVTFGTQAATSFVVDSSTQITAVVPPSSSGPVAITITTESGQVTSSFNYVYTAASIVPTSQTLSGSVNQPISPSVAFTPTNFSGSITYAVTAGLLPQGLSIDIASGVISGTPTESSSTTITITATGASGIATASVTFAITKPLNAVTTSSTTTTTPTTPTVVVSAAAPTLVTPANQAQLEAEPGEAVAIINGKPVEVEAVKVETPTATPDALREVAKEIVNAIEDALPKGTTSGISVVNTAAGAELSGLMVNPDDPKEKLNVPVESVTLLKAGESAILISALNQTNLPAEVAPGGVLQVTRGGLVAATAYGLPGSETGEIVLMSTPRLLQTFTVSSNGSYKGQVPLPKDISFGSHTVVMATKNAKVSLGIKLVRTRMQFRIKRKISSRIFLNRAGVVKVGGGKVTVKGAGRCRANTKRVVMASKPGGCYVTVRQAAKGANKAIYYRFTVSVVKKLPKKVVAKKK